MDHLHILWTNADPLTSENMVFMYGINSLKKGWWDKVTIIIWGATAKLAAENDLIAGKIGEARDAGAHITACKACADKLGVADRLSEMGIEVKYWGEGLTDLIKSDRKLLTL